MKNKKGPFEPFTFIFFGVVRSFSAAPRKIFVIR